MKPLLRISSVPMSIEYKVTKAALKHSSTPAKLNITRNKGSLNISSRPARINIDSFETRASAGNKSVARLSEDFAQEGRAAGYEATRTYAENGNYLMDSYGSKSAIADLTTSKMIRPPQTVMAFIPSVRPTITADPGQLSFDPVPDTVNFDWNINHKPQLEFIPGSIEFSIAQYNQLNIEYVGSPIYVPPSADPNYEPPPGIDTSV